VLLSALAVPLSLVAAWYVVRPAPTVRHAWPVLDASSLIPSVATTDEVVVAPRVEPTMARDVPIALDAPIERDVLTRDARATRPRDRPVAVDAPLPELPAPMALRATFQAMTPEVRGCVGTATGTVLVAVTFLGTGRVERVQVVAPWAGTPSGACIVAVISRLRIARFRQERFTFSWPYVIPTARQPSQP
jgi:hypothetical protein